MNTTTQLNTATEVASRETADKTAVNILTPGGQTTEYAQARSSSLWGTVGTVLGAIVAMSPLVDAGGNSKFAAIAGAIIAAASIAMKTLTTLGYIKSRTDVKTTASAAAVQNKAR